MGRSAKNQAPSIPVQVRNILNQAPEAPFPKRVKPMLATLAGEPFDDAAWSYEVKWDGYRALAFLNNGAVELRSRNDKSFNETFYALAAALRAWPVHAVIDGEIVVTNRAGVAHFGSLQNWRSEADGLLIFYAFDILWLEGKDLTALPLDERREVLRGVIPAGHEMIRLSETFVGSGQQAFETARKMGLEGIMAKRRESVYQPGERSKDWLKWKAHKRQEMVIGGFTRNEGSTKPFSSLLVGVFEGEALRYTGKIGTGFSVKTQKELLAQFRVLERQTNPFSTLPDINSPSRFRPNPPKATATWLEPKLVCEVSYTELTADGIMRHPSFQGMRTDKDAREVRLEQADSNRLSAAHKKLAETNIITPSGKRERHTLLNPTEKSQVRAINGHELKLANLDKIFWPDEGITKRDVLNYYYQVAPYILPYLKDRPQALHRYPNGITGKNFFQKDVKGKVPDWIDTYTYYSVVDRREKEFPICNDEASLLYLVSLGCIEINIWNSTAIRDDYPDWCVFDLDPDRNTFEQVIQAAQVTKEVLDLLSIPSYCKTSGSTGLHVYVPLGGKYTYEESKEFARAVVTVVHSAIPEFTSIERQIADRGGKMYLDFLQNRPQATIVAPYCLRPKPGATVSMPLHWEEVKPGLHNGGFTIHNAVERIRREGDIFKPVLGKPANLNQAMKQLKTLLTRR